MNDQLFGKTDSAEGPKDTFSISGSGGGYFDSSGGIKQENATENKQITDLNQVQDPIKKEIPSEKVTESEQIIDSNQIQDTIDNKVQADGDLDIPENQENKQLEIDTSGSTNGTYAKDADSPKPHEIGKYQPSGSGKDKNMDGKDNILESLAVAGTQNDEANEKKDLVEMSRKKSAKKGLKGVFIFILLGIAASVILAIAYFHFSGQKGLDVISEFYPDQNLETKEVLGQVGKLVLLPESETPNIVTITDTSKLSNQAFFQGVVEGDKVIIYPVSKKAILYRPSINKIINFSTVNIEGNVENPKEEVAGESTDLENEEESLKDTPENQINDSTGNSNDNNSDQEKTISKQPLKVAIYEKSNNIKKILETQMLLEDELEDYKMEFIDGAKPAEEFEKTTVVAVNRISPVIVNEIADLIGGEAGNNSTLKIQSEADIFIILTR